MRLSFIGFMVTSCVAVFAAPGARAQIQLGPAEMTPCGPAAAVASADFDGDGTRDVAVIRYNTPSFVLLRNTGLGSFVAPSLHALGTLAMSSIVAADFDGDGDIDVAGLGANSFAPPAASQIGVALNLGGGTFAPPIATPLPGFGTSLAAARLNADPFPDLVYCNPSASLVQVLIGSGNGSFSIGPAITSLPNAEHVQPADMDGDGDRDLVVAQRSGVPAYRVFKNNGAGAFSFFNLATLTSGGEGPHGLACGDVDGDGDVDVVGDRHPASPSLPGAGGALSVLRNNGQGALAPPVESPGGGVIRNAVLSDLDADGAPDVIVSDSMLAGLLVLRNQGAGVFSQVQFRPAGFTDHLAADFDGDGDPDIASVETVAGQVSFIRNHAPLSASGPYPGTNEDLHLLTGVNGTPTTGPGLTIKNARAGDSLGVRLTTPGGGFTGDPFVIAGDLFPTGSAPGSPPGLPMIHVGGPGFFILLDGIGGPFTLGVPAGGFQLPLLVPAGLAGQSALLQAVAFSPGAANAFFAATDAHEIRFVP